MIAKQVQGSDFKKVLDYVHHKAGAKQIGSNMVGKETHELTDEFRISSNLRTRVTKCVYHASLSVSPLEKLTDQKWVEIARAYLTGMEFDENQYVIYRHTDTEHDHIHLIANRIRIIDDSVVSDSWNYRRSEVLVRQLEQQFGLFQTKSSWEKSKRSPSTGEMRRHKRTGEANKRIQIQNTIEQSLKDNPTLEEFISRLKEKKISVRLRKSKEEKIEGISYGLEGVAFQGRQLGKDYTWTSLETLLAREKSHQTSQDDLVLPSEVNIIPEANNFNNQGTESKDGEEEKIRLREKYVSFAAQVRQSVEIKHQTNRIIDMGVVLLSLKAGENLEESKRILTQSDTVKQWHQEIPHDSYLKQATDYIREIADKASEISQRNHARNQAFEWED
jgi:hypothetical protein